MDPEHHDVVVIGGGQAGLAIGYFLAQQGCRFTILDAGTAPAAAWRSRWDSLTLFTPVRYDSLPGLAFPGEPDHYPTRDEVASYLTEYARHFVLPIELGCRVTGLHADAGGYTHLAVGSRQTPLPQRILGRDLFRFLEATGLMNATVTSRIGKRMKDRETLIGSSPRSARKAGITIHARATHAAGSTVTFADGGSLDADAVIWATGFERDYSWIDAPVFDDRGEVVNERGVTRSSGLYFLGMSWQHTRGSALLGWVKDDASHIAERIGT